MTGTITLEKLQSLSKREDVSVILAPQLNLVAIDQKEAKQQLLV
jgi:hypothetical protein